MISKLRDLRDAWKERSLTRNEDKKPVLYWVEVSINGKKVLDVGYPFRPTPINVYDRALRKLRQHLHKKVGRKNVPKDIYQYDPELTQDDGGTVTCLNLIDWHDTWIKNWEIYRDLDKKGEEFVTGKRRMPSREELQAKGAADDLRMYEKIDKIVEKELFGESKGERGNLSYTKPEPQKQQQSGLIITDIGGEWQKIRNKKQ